MTEKEFDKYWKENREEILAHDEEYCRAKDDFKVHSGADLIMFGIPVVTGIVVINNITLQNELLKWIVSALATIVSFAACVWVKSLVTGTLSPDEVEMRIKDKKKRELTQNE